MVPFGNSDDDLPQYNPGSDLVVFPSKDSACWDELSKEELAAARRIILVDSRYHSSTRPCLLDCFVCYEGVTFERVHLS